MFICLYQLSAGCQKTPGRHWPPAACFPSERFHASAGWFFYLNVRVPSFTYTRRASHLREAVSGLSDSVYNLSSGARFAGAVPIHVSIFAFSWFTCLRNLAQPYPTKNNQRPCTTMRNHTACLCMLVYGCIWLLMNVVGGILDNLHFLWNRPEVEFLVVGSC